MSQKDSQQPRYVDASRSAACYTEPVYSVAYSLRRKVWQFPDDRFVRYDKSDEAWARPLGFGKEIEVIETVTVPRAVCVGFSDGALQFKALSSDDLCVSV